MPSSVWRYGSYVLCSGWVDDNCRINRMAWNTPAMFVFLFESMYALHCHCSLITVVLSDGGNQNSDFSPAPRARLYRCRLKQTCRVIKQIPSPPAAAPPSPWHIGTGQGDFIMDRRTCSLILSLSPRVQRFVPHWQADHCRGTGHRIQQKCWLTTL